MIEPLKLSRRATDTPASPIRKLASLAESARAKGREILHLNIGQPDITSPKSFIDAVKNFDKQVVAYEQSQGFAPLCNAWSQYLDSSLNTSIPAEQIIITTGASEAIIFSFMTCCDPGDEILIFDPTYSNFIGFAAISGVRLIPIHTSLEEGFSLPDTDHVESYLSSKTRAILICNPNNPTGSVYSKAAIEDLLDVCERHNLFLIVDETYREFVFDDEKPLSVLEFAKNNPHVIVIDSLSKRYSLCGARIGSLITANPQVLQATINLAQARLASPTIEQLAAAHMLTNVPESYIEDSRIEYQGRRDVICDALNTMGGVEFRKPLGAFYMIVKLPVENAEGFARFLLKDFSLDNRSLFVAPAEGFYMKSDEGRNQIRIAFVLEKKKLGFALDILNEGLKAYRG